jgi:hypothetical protein
MADSAASQYKQARDAVVYEKRKLYVALFVVLTLTMLLLFFYANRDVLVAWGFKEGLPIALGYRFPVLADIIPGLPRKNPAKFAYGTFVATRLGGNPQVVDHFEGMQQFTLKNYARVGTDVANGVSLCAALEQTGIRKSPVGNKVLEGFNVGLQAVGTAIQFAIGDIPGALLSATMLATQVPNAMRIFAGSCLTEQ